VERERESRSSDVGMVNLAIEQWWHSGNDESSGGAATCCF
jgi:hypothetical protein